MDILVINLDERTDRFQHMSRELIGLSWERISATKGQELTLAKCHATGWFPDRRWRDPLTGKSLGYNEIACTMSHYRCWEQVARSNQPTLILEDDVYLTHVLRELPLDYYTSLLQSYDIIYLGYNEMQRQLVTRLGADLLKPIYPYQTSSYCLSPAGARKLLAAPVKKYCLTADEILPIMIGCSYIDYERAHQRMHELVELFRPYDKLNAAAFTFPHVRQHRKETFGTDIDRGNTLSDSETHVITVATDEEKAALLWHSAAKFNAYVCNLGKDVLWHGGDMQSQGGGQKINLVRHYLQEHVLDDDIVVFVDGYDVVINDYIQSVVDRFHEMACDIVFAAEKICWPDQALAERFPETESAYRYLNSGLYVGKGWALKKIMQAEIADNADDQLYLQQQFLDQEQLGIRVKLDSGNYIFQCVSAAADDISIRFNGQLLNSATYACPCILHGNGGGEDKRRFFDLVQQLNAPRE